MLARTLDSKAGSGAKYAPVVITAKYVVVANNGTLEIGKRDFALPEGMPTPIVAQVRAKGGALHFQAAGAEGNRDYGWAFDTTSEFLAARL